MKVRIIKDINNNYTAQKSSDDVFWSDILTHYNLRIVKESLLSYLLHFRVEQESDVLYCSEDITVNESIH